LAGKCVAVFSGHKEGITALCAHDGLLFSGSRDNTIHAWDPVSGQIVVSYRGHDRAISALRCVGGLMYSSSWDKTIRAWDVMTGAVLRTFSGHANPVLSIEVYGDMVYSASSDMTIQSWVTQTGLPANVYDGHTRAVNGIQAADKFVFSAGDDGVVLQWHIQGSELRRIQNTLAQAKSLTESKHAVHSLRERLIRHHKPQLLQPQQQQQQQPKDAVGRPTSPDLIPGQLEGLRARMPPRRRLVASTRARHSSGDALAPTGTGRPTLRRPFVPEMVLCRHCAADADGGCARHRGGRSSSSAAEWAGDAERSAAAGEHGTNGVVPGREGKGARRVEDDVLCAAKEHPLHVPHQGNRRSWASTVQDGELP
jgi:WD40 repeat protein